MAFWLLQDALFVCLVCVVLEVGCCLGYYYSPLVDARFVGMLGG